MFSPGINAIDADVILVHAVFHRIAELQKSRQSGGLRRLHRKLYYALVCSLERRVYANPRVTLAAVSRHTADQLSRYFGRNDVSVIPNGVDGDHFSPAAIATFRERYRQRWKCSPQDFVLLLIGNDWRNKGLNTLLQACSSCKDLPIRLLVVGQDEQAPFRADAKNLGLTSRVEFLAPFQDVRVFYAAADLLVAPSLEDSFNLPVLEAMSCGLPVVVSSRAGVSDWLKNAEDSVILKIGKRGGAERGAPHARVKFLCFGTPSPQVPGRRRQGNFPGRSRKRIAKADGESRAGKVALHLPRTSRLNYSRQVSPRRFFALLRA